MSRLASTVALVLSLFAVPTSLAFAEDDDERPSLGGDPEPSTGGGLLDIDIGDIELTDTKGSSDITYDGSASHAAPHYKPGTTVTVSHLSGPVTVRCTDQPGLNARLSYTVRGGDKDKMKKFGDGFGIATFASTSEASVKTRTPAKVPGVTSWTAALTVNLPLQANVNVSGAQDGVRVTGCTGSIRISTTKGGAYASGTLSGFNVSAGKGNVEVILSDDSVVKAASGATATAGDVIVQMPMKQKATLTATGSDVTVAHLVSGVNSGMRVQGTINEGGPAITLKASGKVDLQATR
jgi:hypothetical protein